MISNFNKMFVFAEGINMSLVKLFVHCGRLIL